MKNLDDEMLKNEKIKNNKFDLTEKIMLIILFLVSIFVAFLIGIGFGREFTVPESKKIEEVVKAEREGRIEIVVIKREINGKLISTDTINYKIREEKKRSL